jgi:glycine cleavage system protein P-like pyridoxal-binding family
MNKFTESIIKADIDNYLKQIKTIDAEIQKKLNNKYKILDKIKINRMRLKNGS